ncbi:unnamed protein product [Prorocentrum cordatum]|uniref:Uncharacterized protein n=1 Tax=Prorocentrum cordatum TaxID=2364126 RepID=A0ABN9ULP1_9DINO|nr:unnamed protein product [Polarella glacialis]
MAGRAATAFATPWLLLQPPRPPISISAQAALARASSGSYGRRSVGGPRASFPAPRSRLRASRLSGCLPMSRRAQQVKRVSFMDSCLPHEQARSAAAAADDAGTQIAPEDGSPARERTDSRRPGRGSGTTARPSPRAAPQDVVAVPANPSGVPTSTSPTSTDSSRPSWSSGSSSAEGSESTASGTSDQRPRPDQQPEPRGLPGDKTVRRQELWEAAQRRRAAQRQAQAQDSEAAAPPDGPDGAPRGAEGSAGDGRMPRGGQCQQGGRRQGPVERLHGVGAGSGQASDGGSHAVWTIGDQRSIHTPAADHHWGRQMQQRVE